ncbi:toxic anion resistance protein [Pseudooceanicola sp. HF7]|uniref:toxic anion resistance protein n=1 Tax=Pseudooceanicola sp. HF7 TaxID=2721560 RepID=UPI0014316D2A|nr:toxic anion resistance protein [Pseudooceanicola sp. HF7]NIZ07857.1 toxic anion resistance protein [Pseudooceanicola sp. HF7]
MPSDSDRPVSDTPLSDRPDRTGTRTRAEQSRALVEEVAELELPEPSPTEYAPEDAALSPEVRALMEEIDLEDATSIMSFGSGAQSELQEISQAMLADVRNKDAGPAGDSLREIVSAIRGFSVSEVDLKRDRSLWDRLSGRAAPLARFTARFEGLQEQVDRITDDLLAHEHRLLKDIRALDKLYEKTLGFYEALALYIAAGSARLAELDRSAIPEAEATLAATREEDKPLAAQALHDLRAARDDLDRRVHDLKLTRQVTMQSLPSIRLVQENDKSLVTRISSTLINTVPLWESQLAQTLTLQRTAEAAGAVKAASDLTNELLTGNARALRQTNRNVREEAERGVFDIEAVREANAELIATIEDSLSIADQGKARRAAAEEDLKQMEADLRSALSAARSQGSRLDRPADEAVRGSEGRDR